MTPVSQPQEYATNRFAALYVDAILHGETLPSTLSPARLKIVENTIAEQLESSGIEYRTLAAKLDMDLRLEVEIRHNIITFAVKDLGGTTEVKKITLDMQSQNANDLALFGESWRGEDNWENVDLLYNRRAALINQLMPQINLGGFHFINYEMANRMFQTIFDTWYEATYGSPGMVKQQKVSHLRVVR